MKEEKLFLIAERVDVTPCRERGEALLEVIAGKDRKALNL